MFQADFAAQLLRKQGIRLRLAEQPFTILEILTERPGELVSREELQRRLWPAEAQVDFEHGLNNAIKKLRVALGDDAENPRFIETIPTKGYRFIAPLESGSVIRPADEPALITEGDATLDLPSNAAAPVEAPQPAVRCQGYGTRGWSWRLTAVVALGMMLVVAGSVAYSLRRAAALSYRPNEVAAVSNFQNFTREAATETSLGHYERAAEDYRQALRLDATHASTYAGLATVMLRLERIADAQSVLEQAEQRGLWNADSLQANYLAAFASEDEEGMERAVRGSENVPRAGARLLASEADTEAYYGSFETARRLSRQAAELMASDGEREAAAKCLALAALREAEAGFTGSSRQLFAEAQKKYGGDELLTELGALLDAKGGDYGRALATSEQLAAQHPSDSIVQRYWIPVIRAEVALRQGHEEEAVMLLKGAEPFENATLDGVSPGPLYPVYLRGQAYLQQGDAAHAGEEFRKLIDSRGTVLNSAPGVLAVLGRARAYALAKDTEKASAAYEEFFELWNDADANIPLLLQARAEVKKLR